MQNPNVREFEQFLFKHDCNQTGNARTHTNMLGGKTLCPEFINSGNYSIEHFESDRLRDLILALPASYRHGLSQEMPDKFNFFVDVDTGKFKQRPTVEALGEWAVKIAQELQFVITENVENSPQPSVAITIISARKVKGGFKPGIHLHVPDLVVDRQTAIYLSSTLANLMSFPNNLRLPCTDRNKLVDGAIYRQDGGALRMYNATKMSDELTRYKLYAIIKPEGTPVLEPSLSPAEIYQLTQLEPAVSISAPAVLKQDVHDVHQAVKRQNHNQGSLTKAIKRDNETQSPHTSCHDNETILPDTTLVGPKNEDEELFEQLLRSKIAGLFPQARVRGITKQNGTVWLVKLNSKFCWMKQSEHDSPSAFLSVTKNGIQPRCSSSICQLKQKLPRVPCFNGAEQLRFFPSPETSIVPFASLELTLHEDPIAKAVVDEYNQRFAYVMVGENNCSLLVLERSVDPLTGYKNVRFMSPKVFSEWNRDERTADGRFKADIWLNSPRQARYRNLVFMPGVDTEPDGWFNMWQGPAWPMHEEWVKMGEQPLEFYMEDPDLKPGLCFIRDIIASKQADTFNYVLNWVALAVQRPDVPSEVILALSGERGIGKSVFGTVISKLFGSYGKVIEAKQLNADFNGSLRNTIMLVGDEASGDFDAEAMVRLQNICTADYLDINQKNIERFRVKNCLHIIIISNFDKVVAAGRDARRYCIVTVSEEHKRDYDYFGWLCKSFTPLFYSKLLTMLSQRSFMGWDKTDWPLASQAPLWENKQIALTPSEHWFYAKLRAATEETWRIVLPKEMVYKESAEFETGKRQKLPRVVAVEQELNAIFKKSGHKVCSTPSGQGMPTTMVAGKKVPAFRFPPFEECRQIFSNYVETNPLILW